MDNLVLAYWNDPVWLAILCVIALIVIYYIIQYIRSSRNHRDSADDYAKGCLEALGFGCLAPLTLMVLLVAAVVW